MYMYITYIYIVTGKSWTRHWLNIQSVGRTTPTRQNNNFNKTTTAENAEIKQEHENIHDINKI